MELFVVLVSGFTALIVGVVTGALIERSVHDKDYRKTGHCPSGDYLKKGAEKKKEEAERVLGA